MVNIIIVLNEFITRLDYNNSNLILDGVYCTFFKYYKSYTKYYNTITEEHLHGSRIASFQLCVHHLDNLNYLSII